MARSFVFAGVSTITMYNQSNWDIVKIVWLPPSQSCDEKLWSFRKLPHFYIFVSFSDMNGSHDLLVLQPWLPIYWRFWPWIYWDYLSLGHADVCWYNLGCASWGSALPVTAARCFKSRFVVMFLILCARWCRVAAMSKCNRSVMFYVFLSKSDIFNIIKFVNKLWWYYSIVCWSLLATFMVDFLNSVIFFHSQFTQSRSWLSSCRLWCLIWLNFIQLLFVL